MTNQKIKNKHYRDFLDNGIIKTINEEDLKKALANIKGRNVKEGRALLIALYYTGARPNEVLNIKGKDVQKNKTYITISLKGSKGGLPRTIYLRSKNPLIMEFYKFATSLFNEMYIFHHYKGRYVRTKITKKGFLKTRIETSDNLRYHVKKWFAGVLEDPPPPYYLRHNRFSKLSIAGIDLMDLRFLKGSKTTESVLPYLHMSSSSAKKVAKKID